MCAKTAFLLCKSDVFLRTLLPQFLTFLEDNNFSIKDYLVGRVTESHFRLMYTTHFRCDVDDWHHNQKIYDFGPALGLLLKNDSAISTLQSLIQLKGSALPKDRNPNSIRYLFGSKSRLFNLIHVPDTNEQSDKETLSWFGGCKFEDNSSQFPITKEEILHEINQHGYQEIGTLDPEYAFLKAKIRLMHAIQKKYIGDSIVDYVQTLKFFYLDWSEEIIVNSSSPCNGIEGTILASKYEKERELLRILNGKHYDLPLLSNTINFLQMLVEKPRYVTNFFWILEEWNVFISALEQYLITSRLKYN